jgi:tetratricopeptide (TPR) repeat protein
MTFWPKLLIALLAIGGGVMARADEKPWVEVRSPHFRIITNGSDRSAAHVAREFEQMRSVFAAEFPGFVLDPPTPLLILAPKDEETFNSLAPALRKLGNTKVAGFYRQGWDKRHAVFRLDLVGSDRFNPDNYSVLYHEYVHSLLHSNFHWLPIWLDEGLAEFYAYTRFEGAHAYVGAPPKNPHGLDLLDRRAAMPIEEFIEKHRFVTSNTEQTGFLYAQSWALTHFLTFGPGMEQGEKLKRFFNAIQKGQPQKAAFVESFGSFEDANKNFGIYLLRFTFTSAEIPNPAIADERAFSLRTMSQAETEAVLAEFRVWMRDWQGVRTLAEASVKHDPKLGLAQEALGFVELNEGHPEEALRGFSRAVELDDTLYLSLFAKAMLSVPLNKSAADWETLREELLKVTARKPDFAPAYVQLAKVYLAEGAPDKALSMSMKAEDLAPFRPGYHLLSGEILRRMGDPGDAAKYAGYVADRWAFPDRDEAFELWNRVPEKFRRGAMPPENAAVAGLNSTEGVVESVTCQGTAFGITLLKGADKVTFKSTHTPVGFTDTNWLGDHFTPCFYVKGLRAMVHYRQSSDKAYDGELVNAGFRDDLPPEHKLTAESSK